jgi:hypothetical protein
MNEPDGGDIPLVQHLLDAQQPFGGVVRPVKVVSGPVGKLSAERLGLGQNDTAVFICISNGVTKCMQQLGLIQAGIVVSGRVQSDDATTTFVGRFARSRKIRWRVRCQILPQCLTTVHGYIRNASPTTWPFSAWEPSLQKSLTTGVCTGIVALVMYAVQ